MHGVTIVTQVSYIKERNLEKIILRLNCAFKKSFNTSIQINVVYDTQAFLIQDVTMQRTQPKSLCIKKITVFQAKILYMYNFSSLPFASHSPDVTTV
jgi:hypothetical protein